MTATEQGSAKVLPVAAPRAAFLAPLVTGVIVIGALYLARDVLVPIVLAVLLAFVLAPLVGLMRKLRLGRTPSVIIAVLGALAIVAMTGTVIGQQVAGLASDLPATADRIQTKIRTLGKSDLGRLPAQISRMARRFETNNPTPTAPRLTRRARPIPVEVHEPPESAWQMARRLLAPVVGPLETLVIVLVVAIFVLLQRDDLRDRVIRLFGSSDLHRTTRAIDEAAGRLSRYFLTQLLLNGLFGGVIAIGLWWIGIPSPLLWGLLAALLRFVPYIGAFLAALPPLLLAVGGEPGWTLAIMTAALFLISEPVMGYVIEPMVYGHSTGLSPLAVIVAAIFWTWLWGPIGLLLAMPLTLCLVVLGRHVPQLEFLDVLFGDRPALTPVESFYQRMLAGDVGEALEQAEQLLTERSLSAYYDEVVVPGLRLALSDRRRGVVSRQVLDGIVESTRELIEGLEEHDDKDPTLDEAALAPVKPSLAKDALPARAPPEPAEGSGPVLCLTGPGTTDPVIAAMLTQLLVKHGRQATMGGVDAPSDAAIICLVGAELRPSSPRWRTLEARARRAWPDARFVRALLPPGRVGDGECCASLRDMVEACGGPIVVAEEGLEPPTPGL